MAEPWKKQHLHKHEVSFQIIGQQPKQILNSSSSVNKYLTELAANAAFCTERHSWKTKVILSSLHLSMTIQPNKIK